MKVPEVTTQAVTTMAEWVWRRCLLSRIQKRAMTRERTTRASPVSEAWPAGERRSSR